MVLAVVGKRLRNLDASVHGYLLKLYATFGGCNPINDGSLSLPARIEQAMYRVVDFEGRRFGCVFNLIYGSVKKPLH